MKILFFLIGLTNAFALDSLSIAKPFSFQKKAPNTTPNLFRITKAFNSSSLVLSLTTYNYFDSLSQKQEGNVIKLKKVRDQAALKFKKFLNSKSLTKNIFNLCWSNPRKNSAKCYGSVSKFKCNQLDDNIYFENMLNLLFEIRYLRRRMGG